jgi:DNA-binding transcriptional LysR family regulator
LQGVFLTVTVVATSIWLIQQARKRTAHLADVVQFPLILYERGSTGRQHVAEAFQRRNLVPLNEIEATNTDLIVRMVEAGWGLPLCRCTRPER